MVNLKDLPAFACVAWPGGCCLLEGVWPPAATQAEQVLSQVTCRLSLEWAPSPPSPNPRPGVTQSVFVLHSPCPSVPPPKCSLPHAVTKTSVHRMSPLPLPGSRRWEAPGPTVRWQCPYRPLGQPLICLYHWCSLPGGLHNPLPAPLVHPRGLPPCLAAVFCCNGA